MRYARRPASIDGDGDEESRVMDNLARALDSRDVYQEVGRVSDVLSPDTPGGTTTYVVRGDSGEHRAPNAVPGTFRPLARKGQADVGANIAHQHRPSGGHPGYNSNPLRG